MENQGIRDARTLGMPKMLILGLQHMFAMFGATVLVPALTGLSVSATLLFAGLATLFMHLVTGKKVPVFLGSSFAFLGGYFSVVAGEQNLRDGPVMPHGGAGVLRVFQQAVPVGLFLKALCIGQNTGHHAADGIRHCHGGNLAAGEDEIAHADFLVHALVNKALVNALIMAADQNQVIVIGF